MATNRGFTLVELLFYVGMLTLLMIVIMDTIVNVTRLHGRQAIAESVARSALIALNRIDHEVLVAHDASALGDSLALESTDENGNPRSVEFTASGSAIVWSENGVD